MIRNLALTGLLMVAGPALAIQEATPEPDQVYRVVDVAQGSRLNLRAQPGTGAPVVDSLGPDRSGVVVTGVRREIEGQVWWQVPFDDADSGTAWVHSRYLTPQDPHGERQQGFPLQCSGTEPFWSLELDGERARFQAMGEQEHLWEAGSPRTARGTRGHLAVALEPASDEERLGQVAVSRTYRFCSDGMSDFQYPYQLMLITPGGEVYSGCCRRRR